VLFNSLSFCAKTGLPAGCWADPCPSPARYERKLKGVPSWWKRSFSLSGKNEIPFCSASGEALTGYGPGKQPVPQSLFDAGCPEKPRNPVVVQIGIDI